MDSTCTLTVPNSSEEHGQEVTDGMEHWVTSSKSLEVDSWYFAAMVFDNPASGDKTLKIYLDGELEGTINVETNIAPNHTDDDGLGAVISDSKVQTGTINGSGSSRTNHFDGKMDEFRVTDTARDSDWLKTRYHSELGGATFIFVDTIASTRDAWTYRFCNCYGNKVPGNFRICIVDRLDVKDISCESIRIC